jgi:hypothetical protein
MTKFHVIRLRYRIHLCNILEPSPLRRHMTERAAFI